MTIAGLQRRIRRIPSALAALACLTIASFTFGGSDAQRQQARDLTLELAFGQAAKILQGAEENDTALRIESGRLLLYQTEYDRAAEVLDRPDIARNAEGALLAGLARNCAQAMAGSMAVRDELHGVVVRMQDDSDRWLVPYLGEVAQLARETLTRDLGVELPLPIRIELVIDQTALSAMTGLPKEAARKTGTVAVANWGRVTMVSPKATPAGYPWMDTLAHEMTHLAIASATHDRAPLWFQEGVAKREETRWRSSDPQDDYPPVDSIAATGFERGLGLELNSLGPSLAMLPSATQAMVAFAEVQSFLQFLVQRNGQTFLPKLIAKMRENQSADVEAPIHAITHQDLAAWSRLWRSEISSTRHDLPSEIWGGAISASQSKAARNLRLANLLHARGHEAAVVKVLEPISGLVPEDQRIRARLGSAYAALDRPEDTRTQVEQLQPTLYQDSEVHVLRGWILHKQGDEQGAQRAFFRALSLDPWRPVVACEMVTPPALPAAPQRADLCFAARNR